MESGLQVESGAKPVLSTGHVDVLLTTAEVDQSSAAVLTPEALPAIDRQLEKTVVVINSFIQGITYGGCQSIDVYKLTQIFEVKDRLMDALEPISQQRASTLSTSRHYLEQFSTNIKNDVQQSDQVLDSLREANKKALSAVVELTNPMSNLPEEITLELFSKYNLDTPKGLRDKPADELISKILKAFGHKNFGPTLYERRDYKNSSFTHPNVPGHVRNLIRFQGLSSDSSLDGEHARPTLLALREELRGQLSVRERFSELQETLAKEDTNSAIKEVLRVFQISEPVIQVEMNNRARGGRNAVTSELSQVPVQIKQAAFASFDVALKESEVKQKKETLDLLEKVRAPLVAVLDAAIQIATPRDQAIEEEERRQRSAQFIQSCIADPVLHVSHGLHQLTSAFKDATDYQKHSIVGALVTELENISWFQFWRFRHRTQIRNGLKEILLEEISQISEKFSTDGGQDFKSSSTLARAVEATKVLPSNDRSQIMAALWQLPADIDLIEHAAKQIFGTSEIRGDESIEEKRARATRRIASTAESFEMAEDSLQELRE